MDLQTIKETYTMPEILARCNIPIKRGFCNCVFHSGDNTASMKVYKDGYYCFGCGKGGDIITFVREYYGLNFKDACKWITGKELTRRNKTQLAIASYKRKRRERIQNELKQELKDVHTAMTGVWQFYLMQEPFSDEWTEAYNFWQGLCYQQEYLYEQLGDT